MISATLVQPKHGFELPGISGEEPVAEGALPKDGSDFLAQLLVVLGGADGVSAQSDAEPDASVDVAQQESEALALQNMPIAPLPQAVVSAIFAAPLSVPSTVSCDAVPSASLQVPPQVVGTQLQEGLELTQADSEALPERVLQIAAAPVLSAMPDPSQVTSQASPLAPAEISVLSAVQASTQATSLMSAPATAEVPVLSVVQASTQATSLTSTPATAMIPASVEFEPATSSAKVRVQAPADGPRQTSGLLSSEFRTVSVEPLASATVKSEQVQSSLSGLLLQQPESDMPLADAGALRQTAGTPEVQDVTAQALSVEATSDESVAGLTNSRALPWTVAHGHEGVAAPLAQAAAAPVSGSSGALTALPDLESSQRMPFEPHQMRLDSGPVQVEVLKLVRQGGGQILLELTPPDQGTYRVELRLDAHGRAQLMVEGASDSVRTRLEQGEAGLRDQLTQMGLSLELNYRQQGREFAGADRFDDSDRLLAGSGVQGAGVVNAPDVTDTGRLRGGHGLVHLYA